MSLNIKDPVAHDLARQVATRTGESLTRAVVEALRERLQRLSRRPGRRATAEDLLAIGRRCAALLTVPGHSLDHGRDLYDEHGLPR
jgi:antitoxin VapB